MSSQDDMVAFYLDRLTEEENGQGTTQGTPKQIAAHVMDQRELTIQARNTDSPDLWAHLRVMVGMYRDHPEYRPEWGHAAI